MDLGENKAKFNINSIFTAIGKLFVGYIFLLGLIQFICDTISIWIK